MTRNEEIGGDRTPGAEVPATSASETERERPAVRWAGLEPVGVGWIVDAQGEFPGRGARLRALGANGVIEVASPEAVDALRRAGEWMGGRCPVVVYTGDRPDAAHLIAAIRPAGPLVLDGEADDERAEDVGFRAIAEGRPVLVHRTGDGAFEEHRACGTLLAAVETAFDRPVELFVAGFARDGSLARVRNGLLSHGHLVTVVRDAVFASGSAGPESPSTGEGTVASLAELRESTDGMRQVSFADLEVEDAYENLDALMGRPSVLTPLARLEAAVPWALYSARLEAGLRRREDAHRTHGPFTGVGSSMLFRSILLGAIYELSDGQLEFLLHDRLSFKRFAGLGMTDVPPSAPQLRAARRRWSEAGALEDLFADVDARWRKEGYRFRGLRRVVAPASARDAREEVRLEVQGPEPARWAVSRRGGGGAKGGGGRKRLSRRQRRMKRGKRR